MWNLHYFTFQCYSNTFVATTTHYLHNHSFERPTLLNSFYYVESIEKMYDIYKDFDEKEVNRAIEMFSICFYQKRSEFRLK